MMPGLVNDPFESRIRAEVGGLSVYIQGEDVDVSEFLLVLHCRNTEGCRGCSDESTSLISQLLQTL